MPDEVAVPVGAIGATATGDAGPPVASARMYAATPAVRDHWHALFRWVSARAGVPLTAVEHAAPAPLEDLWTRPDLGCTFMCGFPYATSKVRLRLLAAPVPSPARYCGRPIYFTDLVVRRDSAFRTLEDTFGGILGWTVEHSQSGYNALLYHLSPFATDGANLYRRTVGPLTTPPVPLPTAKSPSSTACTTRTASERGTRD